MDGNVTHLKKIRFNLKKILFLRIDIFISISNPKKPINKGFFGLESKYGQHGVQRQDDLLLERQEEREKRTGMEKRNKFEMKRGGKRK